MFVVKNNFISVAKFILIIIWMGLIFFMSSQGADASSGLSSVFTDQIMYYIPGFTEDTITFIVRKSAHIFMYVVLGIFLYGLINSSSMSQKRRILYSLSIAFGYAVFDEIHQTFVPGRSGEVRDILIDTISASLGILAITRILKLYGAYRNKLQ